MQLENKLKVLKFQIWCQSPFIITTFAMGFPGGSVVRNLPAMQGTGIQPLDWEDPLGEGMATHSSTLTWRILWTEKPGGYSP